MFFLDRVAYFLITRAKAVVDYLKKFTKPRYVIAFVLIYPHIYTNILTVVSAAQMLMINIADQFYSWIEASFWGVYGYIRDKLQNIWFAEQIAFLVAGITMAFPYLAYVIFRYAFIPVANALLVVSLNVLGVIHYVFCRVVIPALKMAYGAYIFARFMPASYKYVAKALERFAQGRFGGFVGALFGAVAPFSGFFIGPLIISIVADPACGSAYAPLGIDLPYLIPYAVPPVYQFALEPAMSWLIASIYGQYLHQQLPATAYISAHISWDIQRLVTYSHIIPHAAFTTLTATFSRIQPHLAFEVYIGAYWPYYPPYYPGAYVSPMPALSTVHPYFSYLLLPTYLPYTISMIYPSFYHVLTPGLAVLTVLIEDPSYIVQRFPTPLYIHTHIEDLSYIIYGSPVPYYIHAHIIDLSYLVGPPSLSAEIFDYSHIVSIDSGLVPGLVSLRARIFDYSYIVYPV